MSRRILMVAGEASGDALGARLASALLRADPSLHLYGVGGSAMRAAASNGTGGLIEERGTTLGTSLLNPKLKGHGRKVVLVV